MPQQAIANLRQDLRQLESELFLADVADDRSRVQNLESLCFSTEQRIELLAKRQRESALYRPAVWNGRII